MSDNVNVLIDKMNQESLKKKRVPVGARAIGTTAQSDDVVSMSVDDNGKPYGAVGTGLVPRSVAGDSHAGRSVGRKG